MGQSKRTEGKGDSENVNDCDDCRNPGFEDSRGHGNFAVIKGETTLNLNGCDVNLDCENNNVRGKKKFNTNRTSQSRQELDSYNDRQRCRSEMSSPIFSCEEAKDWDISNSNTASSSVGVVSMQEMELVNNKASSENSHMDFITVEQVLHSDITGQGTKKGKSVLRNDGSYVVMGKSQSVVCSKTDGSVVSQRQKSSCNPEMNMMNDTGQMTESNGHGFSDDGHMTANGSTDFSRFKESNPCDTLFPSNVWSSLENDDLDSFSKHVETNLVGFNDYRKRSLQQSGLEAIVCDEDDGDVVPCKKTLLDEGEPSTSLQQFRSRNVRDSNQGVTGECQRSKAKGLKAYPKIPDDFYVALDCEMVGVGARGSRSVLGRCSIVGYDGDVLYDCYVRPMEPVTDFRTRWSGISPAHMRNAEPTWKAWRDIHQCLKNKIVIGHSVKNDFNVVHFHPHRYLVRDTSRCNLLSKMADLVWMQQGNSLKSLTKRILGKDIQVGRKGHDSVEDARATLELFKVVREEWEQQLFAEWSRCGMNVQDFVTSLIAGRDFNDEKGASVINFGTSGSPVGARTDSIGGCNAKTNTPKTNVNNNPDLPINNSNNNDNNDRNDSCSGVCENGSTSTNVDAAHDIRYNVCSGGTVHSSNRRVSRGRGGQNGNSYPSSRVDYLSDEFWPSNL